MSEITFVDIRLFLEQTLETHGNELDSQVRTALETVLADPATLQENSHLIAPLLDQPYATRIFGDQLTDAKRFILGQTPSTIEEAPEDVAGTLTALSSYEAEQKMWEHYDNGEYEEALDIARTLDTRSPEFLLLGKIVGRVSKERDFDAASGLIRQWYPNEPVIETWLRALELEHGLYGPRDGDQRMQDRKEAFRLYREIGAFDNAADLIMLGGVPADERIILYMELVVDCDEAGLNPLTWLLRTDSVVRLLDDNEDKVAVRLQVVREYIAAVNKDPSLDQESPYAGLYILHIYRTLLTNSFIYLNYAVDEDPPDYKKIARWYRLNEGILNDLESRNPPDHLRSEIESRRPGLETYKHTIETEFDIKIEDYAAPIPPEELPVLGASEFREQLKSMGDEKVPDTSPPSLKGSAPKISPKDSERRDEIFSAHPRLDQALDGVSLSAEQTAQLVLTLDRKTPDNQKAEAFAALAAAVEVLNPRGEGSVAKGKRLMAAVENENPVEALQELAGEDVPGTSDLAALKARLVEMIASLPDEEEISDLTENEFAQFIKFGGIRFVMQQVLDASFFASREGAISQWNQERVWGSSIGQITEDFHKINRLILDSEAAAAYRESVTSADMAAVIQSLPPGERAPLIDWLLEDAFSTHLIKSEVTLVLLSFLLEKGYFSQEEMDLIVQRIIDRGRTSTDPREKLEAAAILYELAPSLSNPSLLQATKYMIETDFTHVWRFDFIEVGSSQRLNPKFENTKLRPIRFSELMGRLKGRSFTEAYRHLKKTALQRIQDHHYLSEDSLEKLAEAMEVFPPHLQTDLALSLLTATIENSDSRGPLTEAEFDPVQTDISHVKPGKTINTFIQYVPDGKRASIIKGFLPLIASNPSELFLSISTLSRLLSFVGQKASRKILIDYLNLRGSQFPEERFKGLKLHESHDIEMLLEYSTEEEVPEEKIYEVFKSEFLFNEYGARRLTLSTLTDKAFLNSRFFLKLLQTKTFLMIPEEIRGPVEEGIRTAITREGGLGGIPRDVLRGLMNHLLVVLEVTLWKEFSQRVEAKYGVNLSGVGPEKAFVAMMNHYLPRVADPSFLKDYGLTLSYLYSFPAVVREEFAKNILADGPPAELSDLRLRMAKFLRENLVETLNLTPEEATLVEKSLRDHQDVWMKEDLLPNLLAAAHYTNWMGKAFVKRLILDLAEAPAVEGDFDYNGRRFGYLLEEGVPPEMLEEWKKEFFKTLMVRASDEKVKQGPVDKTAAYQIALAQLKDHLVFDGVDLKKEQEVTDYLVTTYGQEVSPKHREAYHEVLQLMGDVVSSLAEGSFVSPGKLDRINTFFAALGSQSLAGLSPHVQEASVNFKVLSNTLTATPRRILREEVRITSHVPKLLNKGTEPDLSCQRVHERTDQNVNGEPFAMVLLGQFKLAQYLFDGKVAARSVLELDPQPDGVHLKAERLYPGPGFTQEHVEKFEDVILGYAEQLGIPEERVHIQFTGRNMEKAPPSQSYGLPVYRDTFASAPTRFNDHLSHLYELLRPPPSRAAEELKRLGQRLRALLAEEAASDATDAEGNLADRGPQPSPTPTPSPQRTDEVETPEDDPQASFDGSFGMMQGTTIFEGGSEIKMDYQVMQVGSIQVFEFEENAALKVDPLLTDEQFSSNLPEDFEAMIFDCISLAEIKGLTEIANYLELADDAEASELFSENPTELYRNMIEHGYAPIASQLSQSEVELTQEQVILLNAALFAGAPDEVLALANEWTPETTSSPSFQTSVIGNPTNPSTLRTNTFLRVVK